MSRIDKRATNGEATGTAYANAHTVLQDDGFIYYSLMIGHISFASNWLRA